MSLADCRTLEHKLFRFAQLMDPPKLLPDCSAGPVPILQGHIVATEEDGSL